MCGQWVGGLQVGVPGGHLGSLVRQQIVVACTEEATVEMAKGGWTRETSRKRNQQKLRVDNVGREAGNPRKSPPFCRSLRWRPCGRTSRFPGKRLMSSIADVEKETSGTARRGSLLDSRARSGSGSTICCGDTSGTRMTVKKAQAVFSLCIAGHWPRA